MNQDAILEALFGGGIMFFAGLMTLGVVAMLREGLGEPDRRGDFSAYASFRGVVGLILLPVVSALGIGIVVKQTIEVGRIAGGLGMIVGLVLAVAILGKQALWPRRH